MKSFKKLLEAKGYEMKELNRWLTPDDVALPTMDNGYGIPKQTQSKLRMNGKIPYSKLSNKYIRYDRLELDKWIENHAVVKAV